jgi:hypothetical protein
MKKTVLFVIAILASHYSNSQNTAWSTSGNIGIGTTSPLNALTVVGNQTTYPGNNATFSSNLGSTNSAGNQVNITNNTSNWGLLAGFDGPGVGTGGYHGPNTGFLINVQNAPLIFGTNNSANVTILPNGYVGLGNTSPLTRLHIIGNGSSIDAGNAYLVNGDDLAVQGNTGGRSTTTGAQIEFIIPANTDGTNLWGQGRIITVAGNGNNYDATGKMILGTRRNFNKLGTGSQWYYGNDLTIDGNGFIGVNTTNTHGYQFAVNGTAIATSMTVQAYLSWPDYVFKPAYSLPSLAEVKTYIDQNHHLPEIPSAEQIEKDGLNLGEMNKLLVKKVEELTLYLIELNKQVKQQQKEIDQLKKNKQ